MVEEASEPEEIQPVEPVSLGELNFLHQAQLKGELRAKSARLSEMRGSGMPDYKELRRLGFSNTSQELRDDPIISPTQPYPAPPVTPPELLREPPGLEPPDPVPPVKPASILQRFAEEVDVTKLVDVDVWPSPTDQNLDRLLESGSAQVRTQIFGCQYTPPEDDEYGDLTDCEDERDLVGLRIFRCQWQDCCNELPDDKARCVECAILLCEECSFRCHKCDITPFCAQHWIPESPGHSCQGMPWHTPSSTRVPEEILSKVWLWRGDIMKAVEFERWNELTALLKRLWKLPVHTHILQCTGIGHILSDSWIWGHADQDLRGRALELLAKFKRVAKESAKLQERTPKPWAGANAKTFVERIHLFMNYFRELDPTLEDPNVLRMAALACCWRALRKPSELHTVPVHAARRWHTMPAVRGLLEHAVEVQQMIAAESRARRQADRNQLMLAGRATSSAGETVSVLRDESKDVQNYDKTLQDICPEIANKSKPRDVITALTRKRNLGDNVQDMLQLRAYFLTLETRRGSRQDTASAVNCWKQYSQAILDYPEDHELPPRRSQDVVNYISIFSNGATASNYVGALTWTCKALDLWCGWRTEAVAMTIKGLKKYGLQNFSGKLAKYMTLKHEEVLQLCNYSDQIGDQVFSVFCLCGWKGLMRMQSECFGLEVGEASEFLQLPEGRHSAVFYDAAGRLVIRWRQRKNRPQGSFIIRPCDCHVDGPQYCLCCRMKPIIAASEVGWRLWPSDYRPESMMKLLKARLLVLGHKHHAVITWRAFRAGRATYMAAAGYGLGAILIAGDWASAGVFKYMKEELADHEECMRQVLSKEEKEPEDET